MCSSIAISLIEYLLYDIWDSSAPAGEGRADSNFGIKAISSLTVGSLHFIPCDALKQYVDRFTISEAEDESAYKVLPGTGVVIGFQFKGKLYQVNKGIKTPLSRSGVTGLSDTYKLFENSADIGTVLVYFKDGGASVFFREPIHELFGSSLSLDNFILRSELLLLEEQLSEADAHADKIKVVEQFLLSRIRVDKPDMLVVRALNLIYERNGNVRISDLSDQLNISQSPLEKRFRKVVGASPKKFASIVRFRHILKSHSNSSLTGLGLDAGFYDQSHFIKEFKKFTGDTPDNYFNPE